MSKELVRSSQKYLANSTDESLRKDTGKALMTVGAGGLALYGIAGIFPFVSLPVLLVFVVLFGGYLRFRG